MEGQPEPLAARGRPDAGFGETGRDRVRGGTDDRDLRSAMRRVGREIEGVSLRAQLGSQLIPQPFDVPPALAEVDACERLIPRNPGIRGGDRVGAHLESAGILRVVHAGRVEGEGVHSSEPTRQPGRTLHVHAVLHIQGCDPGQP